MQLGADARHRVGDVLLAYDDRAPAQVHLELCLKLRPTGVAVVWIDGQRLATDVRELGIDVGHHGLQRGHFVQHQAAHDLCVAAGAPQAPARDNLPEHHAHGEDIGAMVEALPSICSGAMYASLPLMTPVFVCWSLG